MKHILTAAALMLGVNAAPAYADAPTIARNAHLYTTDGVNLGRIDRVLEANGAISGVRIIVGGKMVTVPGSTITTGDKGVVTSLTRQEVKKLQ